MTDESALIASARDGDPCAFREIVEARQRGVYQLALHLTGSHEDAEDLSQEAFIHAYRALGMFRGEARLSTWLYRITLNLYLEQQAHRNGGTGRMAAREAQEIIQSIPATSPDPSETAAAAVLDGHVVAALGRLTPRERSVFVLRHYHDLTLREISGILEVRTGTVKSLLFRAVRKLQKELAFWHDGE